MSKLDREIKAIIDDMAEQAQKLVPKLLAVMTDNSLSEEEGIVKITQLLEEAKPKTYEVYIADLKQVFKEAGWTSPPHGGEG